MTNITESKLEQLEVKQSRARLAELAAHMEKVKEQERARIAREIHDDLGGNLTAIKMALATLARRLAPDSAPLPETAGRCRRAGVAELWTIVQDCPFPPVRLVLGYHLSLDGAAGCDHGADQVEVFPEHFLVVDKERTVQLFVRNHRVLEDFG